MNNNGHNKFGFIAHPIDMKSVYGYMGKLGTIAKVLLKEHGVKKIIAGMKPYRLCSFPKIRSLTGSTISGDVMALPMLPIQIASMPEERALDMIEFAIGECEKLGARIVGLGGFASVVGNEGEVLSKRVNVPLTSGNTMTAVLALEGIYRAAYLMGISIKDSICAVIGATGDIGSICTKVLSKKVKKLNIAARNEKRLEEFAKVLRQYGKAEVEVFKYTKDAVKNADIILSATSAVTTVIDPMSLKPGAAVCDVSIPANIVKEVTRLRNDIFVFEGGIGRIAYPEDVKHEKIQTVLPYGGIFGCVAETMALSFEGRFELYSIGRGNITEETINEMKKMGDKHGITLSDFCCGDKFYTDEDIERIRNNAKSKAGEPYAVKK